MLVSVQPIPLVWLLKVSPERLPFGCSIGAAEYSGRGALDSSGVSIQLSGRTFNACCVAFSASSFCWSGGMFGGIEGLLACLGAGLKRPLRCPRQCACPRVPPAARSKVCTTGSWSARVALPSRLPSTKTAPSLFLGRGLVVRLRAPELPSGGLGMTYSFGLEFWCSLQPERSDEIVLHHADNKPSSDSPCSEIPRVALEPKWLRPKAKPLPGSGPTLIDSPIVLAMFYPNVSRPLPTTRAESQTHQRIVCCSTHWVVCVVPQSLLQGFGCGAP